MKICIYGAGAVGGHFAARLGQTNAEVSVIARGAYLDAIKRDGITLHIGEESIHSIPMATAEPRDLGLQDVVITTVKSHSLPMIVDGLKTLVGTKTTVVYAANGIPWWYYYGKSGPDADLALPALDPGNHLRDKIGLSNIAGGVIYSANEVVAPGQIVNRSVKRNRLVLGTVDGSPSESLLKLSAALAKAGIDAPVSADIRTEVWRKFLIGNLTLSLLATLLESSTDSVVSDPEVRRIAISMANEGRALAERLGAALDDLDIPKALAPESIPKGNQPSMLQDFQLGRPMEIDAFITVVLEMARRAGVPMPVFSVVANLVKFRAGNAGLYQPGA